MRNKMRKKDEFNYFDEFAKSAKLATEAVGELKKYVLNFNKENAEVEMKKIHDIENKADKNLHELKNYLLRDFLPPIDREDILEIANKIDDFIDDIDEIVIDLNIYNISEITSEIKELIELLENATKILYDLIIEFKNFKKIQEIKQKVVEVNKIEEQADKIYEKAIKQLYKEETNAIQIMKLSNIYEIIENGFDSCENIADLIDDVLLKNS